MGACLESHGRLKIKKLWESHGQLAVLAMPFVFFLSCSIHLIVFHLQNIDPLYFLLHLFLSWFVKPPVPCDLLPLVSTLFSIVFSLNVLLFGINLSKEKMATCALFPNKELLIFGNRNDRVQMVSLKIGLSQKIFTVAPNLYLGRTKTTKEVFLLSKILFITK